MKKNIMLIISIIITSILAVYAYQLKGELNQSQIKVSTIETEYTKLLLDQPKTDSNIVEMESENNVNNGQSYEYEITSINGDEIRGIPLNKISNDNKGITLYTDELDFNAHVGDKVAVVWGEYEDEFKSITKLN